jgi:hypothetical protein
MGTTFAGLGFCAEPVAQIKQQIRDFKSNFIINNFLSILFI